MRKKTPSPANTNRLEVMGHIVGGYPSKEISIIAGSAILESGASFLEVQFPFSDGNADGKSIQDASFESIKNGFKTSDGFKIIKTLSKIKSKKILAMTYANIIFNYGIKRFINELKMSGGFGIIVPDLMYGENDFNMRQICAQNGISFIELVTPLSGVDRAEKIIKNSSASLIYAVARAGITGKSTVFDRKTIKYIDNVKNICAKYNKKLFLGFGINSKEQILSIDARVDGIVIGSYFVNKIRKSYELDRLDSLKIFLQKSYNDLFI